MLAALHVHAKIGFASSHLHDISFQLTLGGRTRNLIKRFITGCGPAQSMLGFHKVTVASVYHFLILVFNSICAYGRGCP
jgi:hypothetical protein